MIDHCYAVSGKINPLFFLSSQALWAWVLHQARVHDLLLGLLLHCCFILSLYFYNNVLYLTGIWLEYHSLFKDMCFCNQVWGYDMPYIYSFRYSYPLTVMFSSIHTLGTMCDSSLGVWKNETLSNILLCYL